MLAGGIADSEGFRTPIPIDFVRKLRNTHGGGTPKTKPSGSVDGDQTNGIAS